MKYRTVVEVDETKTTAQDAQLATTGGNAEALAEDNSHRSSEESQQHNPMVSQPIKSSDNESRSSPVLLWPGDQRKDTASEHRGSPNSSPHGTGAVNISRLPTTSSASPVDKKTKEYLFPSATKEPVKAPNVTVLHPAAHHPLLNGLPGRLSGLGVPPTSCGASVPFGAAHGQSTLPHQADLLMRVSCSSASIMPPSPFGTHSRVGSNSVGAPIDSRLVGSVFGTAPPSAGTLDAGHLAAASAHAQQIWLQNYYAAALHHLHRSGVPTTLGDLPNGSPTSRYILGGSTASSLHHPHQNRFSPYVLPHTSPFGPVKDNSGIERDANSSPHRESSSISPRSPDLLKSGSGLQLSGGHHHHHSRGSASPIKRQSSSNSSILHTTNSILQQASHELGSLQRTLQSPNDSLSAKPLVKQHSPKSSKFSIESLTAKD